MLDRANEHLPGDQPAALQQRIREIDDALLTRAPTAYLSKLAEDELARRAIEGADRPPLDGRDLPIIAVSRTMDEWLEATDIELLDGPLVFGDFDPDEDAY